MKLLCVEKSDKSNRIKQFFNGVSIKEHKIIIYSDLLNMKLKSKINIVRKIQKILLKENVSEIMLSSDIKKDKEFINLLFSYGISISNDRWLFKMLCDEVVYKIIPFCNIVKSEIWITVNEIDNITQNIIYKFANEFKRVNIITNHIRRFKKIEERLYEECGIMITVTNNRRKSLQSANLILNIDFPKEVLNQFNIYDEATIINLEGDISIKKKRFCGKVINDIKVNSYENDDIYKFIEENNLENYDIKDICNVLNIVPKCDIILI